MNPSNLSKIKPSFLTLSTHWILSSIFAVLAGYLVFIREYDQGNYFHYFFKADFYYANFNKIIIPAGFWCIFLVYLALLRITNSRNSGRWKDSFLIGVYFHLYLLTWTHWGEVVSGFSLIPVNLPGFPGKPVYERAVMALGILAYNIYGTRLLFSKRLAAPPIGWKIVPLSFLIPFFLTPHGATHLIFLVSGFAITVILDNCPATSTKTSGKTDYLIPLFIFFASMAFRLWYAAYISAQGELALGLSADGPAYFKSAMAFAEGNFEDANYYHSPFYALYLSVFLTLFGKTQTTVFYIQAIIGSITPVLVYYIASYFLEKKTACIAGLFAAVSQIGVHHSVVCHRIDPALLALTALAALYLRKGIRSVFGNGTAFGFIAASLFYLAQETLLTILVMTGFWFFKVSSGKQWTKPVAGFLLGGLLAVAPLNVIFFHQYGKFIPVGRDVSLMGGDLSIGVGSNPPKENLVRSGFAPLKNPGESLSAFIEDPVKISSLLFSKFIFDIPGFLLDPGSIYFQPLFLNEESFLGAHLKFYYYGCVVSGFFIFLSTRRSLIREKLFILTAVIIHSLTVTLFLYGTFRHRAPITPFGIIFAAFAFEAFKGKWLLQKNCPDQTEDIHYHAISFAPVGKLPRWLLPTVSIIVFSCISIVALLPEEKALKKDGYNIKNWLAVDLTRGLSFNNKVSINNIVFAYYDTPHETSEPVAISFNICRHLMPGSSPWYRLALDGNYIHSGKVIPHGCRNVKHEFNPAFQFGMATLVVYASKNGESPDLTPGKIVTPGGKIIETPYISDYQQDPALKEYTQRFLKYSNGFVKISQPEIIAHKTTS